MLLKLDYAKFGVSNLLFLKVIEEPLGFAPPPNGKGRVNKTVSSKFCLLIDDSRLGKSDIFYLSIACFLNKLMGIWLDLVCCYVA